MTFSVVKILLTLIRPPVTKKHSFRISSNTEILARQYEIAFTFFYMVYNWVDLGPGGNEPPTATGNLS